MFAKVVVFICLATFASAIPIDYGLGHYGGGDYGHYGGGDYGHYGLAASPVSTLHTSIAAPAVSYAPSISYAHAAPAVVHAAPAVIHAAPAVAVKAEPYDPNPQYSYKYGVTDHHTGDSKHAEETLVNGVVHGSYSLAEPDGTIRKVTYTADKIHGFNAVVEKHGVAKVAVAAPAVIAHAPAVISHAAPAVYAHGYDGYHGYH